MTYNFIFRPKDSICHDDLLRINEKKQHLLSLRHENDRCRKEFEVLANGKRLPERLKLQTEILEKRTKIAKMKERTEQLKMTRAKDLEILAAKKKSIEETNKRIAILREKIDKANKIKDGMARVRWEMGAIQIKLMERERAVINELSTLVFDIASAEPTDPAKIAEKETVHAYVNGCLMTKNKNENEYRIVRSLLPADGSYKSYLAPEPVVVNEQGVPVEPKSSVRRVNTINRRSVVSGLGHVAHFVNLLAFYTNTLLPYNLPFNVFYQDSADEETLTCAVAKLNTNVIYLSIHRGFQVSNFIPERTLENLNHFLQGVNKMTIKARPRHSIVFPDRLIILLENMFKRCNINQLNIDWVFKPELQMDSGDDDWEEVGSADQIPCDDGGPQGVAPSRLSSSSTNSLFNITGIFQYIYPATKTDTNSSTGPQ